MNAVGTMVQWKDEDGTVAIGEIISERHEYSASVGMELTHVTIKWADGHEPTQHTLEAMMRDPRVTIQS